MEKKRVILRNCLLQLLWLTGGKFKVHEAGWLTGDLGKSVDGAGLGPKGGSAQRLLCCRLRQDCFFGKPVFFLRDVSVLDEAHSHCAG